MDTQKEYFKPFGQSVNYIRGIRKNIEILIQELRERGIRIWGSIDQRVATKEGSEKIQETTPVNPIWIPPESEFDEFDVNGNQPSRRELYFLKNSEDVFENINLVRYLKGTEAATIVIFGTMLEECVKNTVLGFLIRGYKTIVIRDAIRSTNPGNQEKTLRMLEQKGAEIYYLEDGLKDLLR